MAAFVRFTATVAALLVAFINVVLAGHAAGASRWAGRTPPGPARSRLCFALGAAGVGIWALAWSLAQLHPYSEGSMDAVASWGVVLASSGFAADALGPLGRRRAFALLAAALGSLAVVLAVQRRIEPRGELPRTLALLGTALLAAGYLARGEGRPGAALARDAVRLLIAWTGLYAVMLVAGLAMRSVPPDPTLLPLLCAESMTLLYVIHHRVEIHVVVSRSLALALLAVALAGAVTAAYRTLGYPVDVVQVIVTVTFALVAAVLTLGVGGAATHRLEQLLFPGRIRLQNALEASRGELAALRRRLERSERLAISGELAAAVAHEIKNPLAPIRGYAQLLNEQLARADAPLDRDIFAKGLRIIGEEADRIDARIQELLRLARGESRPPAATQSVELNGVVLDAVALAEAEPGEPSIRLDLDDAAGRVVGRDDELLGALLNVLKNAVEAMSGAAGGAVEVVTRCEGERTVVEVRDEGVGIDAAAAGRVFEPFFTTKPGGTGLGTTIAQSAVQAAGGRIQLLPRADRRGTVARIELIPAVIRSKDA